MDGRLEHPKRCVVGADVRDCWRLGERRVLRGPFLEDARRVHLHVVEPHRQRAGVDAAPAAAAPRGSDPRRRRGVHTTAPQHRRSRRDPPWRRRNCAQLDRGGTSAAARRAGGCRRLPCSGSHESEGHGHVVSWEGADFRVRSGTVTRGRGCKCRRSSWLGSAAQAGAADGATVLCHGSRQQMRVDCTPAVQSRGAVHSAPSARPGWQHKSQAATGPPALMPNGAHTTITCRVDHLHREAAQQSAGVSTTRRCETKLSEHIARTIQTVAVVCITPQAARSTRWQGAR